MYKAILCDDNEIILEGLKTGINWSSMDITVVGTADDGLKAQQMIERYSPDILITDIRMPIMDGIELIRWAKKHNERLTVIVISGYDDFQYARQTVSLGVIDYVLKPIDMDEFLNVLKKAVETCRMAHKMHRYTVTSLLRAAVHGEMSAEELEKECKNVRFPFDMYLCMIIVDIGREQCSTYQEAVRYELEKKLLDFGETVQLKGSYVIDQMGSRLGVFVQGKSLQETIEKRDQVILEARRSISSDTVRAEVVIAVSDICKGMCEAAQCAEQCEAALNYRFLSGPKAAIYYNDIAAYTQIVPPTYVDDERLDEQLILAIKKANKAEAQNALNLMADYLRQKGGDSYLYMVMCVNRLFAHMERELADSNIAFSSVFKDPLAELKEITTQRNLDGAMNKLNEIVVEMCEFFYKRVKKYSKPIAAAVTYIKDHFNQSDLSIEEVAAAVYLSTAHFSTIFKNEIGITFTDYLINIRMDYAKRLLMQTDQKIYEISIASGYDSAAYFSSAFKKYTGVSPSEFKTSHIKMAKSD